METFARLTIAQIRKTAASATDAQIEAVVRPQAKKLSNILSKTDDREWVLSLLAVALQEHPHNAKLAIEITNDAVDGYPTRESAADIPDLGGKISVQMGGGGCPPDQYWVPNPNIKKSKPGIKPGGYCKHAPGFEAVEGKGEVVYDEPEESPEPPPEPESESTEPEPEPEPEPESESESAPPVEKWEPAPESKADDDGPPKPPPPLPPEQLTADVGEDVDSDAESDVDKDSEEPEEEVEKAPPELFKAQPYSTLSDNGHREAHKYRQHVEAISSMPDYPGVSADDIAREAGIDSSIAKVLKFVLSATNFGFASIGENVGELWRTPVPVGSLLIGAIVLKTQSTKAPVKEAKKVYEVIKERRSRSGKTVKRSTIDLLRVCRLAAVDSMPFATHGHWLASGRPIDFLKAYLGYREKYGDIGITDYFALQCHGHIPPMMAPFYMQVAKIEEQMFTPDFIIRQKKEGFSNLLNDLFLRTFKRPDKKNFVTGMEPRIPSLVSGF